jgi:hypothetical protein
VATNRFQEMLAIIHFRISCSCCLPKGKKIKIHNITILPAVLYGHKIGLPPFIKYYSVLQIENGMGRTGNTYGKYKKYTQNIKLGKCREKDHL